MTVDELDPDDDLRRRFDERELLREAEEAAAEFERSTRTLRDVIDAAMLAGDSVEIEVGEVTVAGQPVGSSDSLVQVHVGPAVRCVNLAAVAVVSVIPGEGGPSHPTGTGDLSLMAFLRSLMSTPPDGPVELVTTSGHRWTGRVVGVAGDHIELETLEGYLRACRLASIAYIEG